VAGSTQGFWDGLGTAANFYNPRGITFDGEGNLIVVDGDNHSIRKVTPLGVVTTIAGRGVAGCLNGKGSIAMFNQPCGICFDGRGELIVADYNNHLIRKISSDL